MRIAFRHLAAVAMLTLLVTDGRAVGQTSPPPNLREWLQRSDRNGDGKLDRAEFQQAIVEAFYFRDKDKNGYLTAAELEGARPEVIRRLGVKADGQLSLDETVNALFKDFEIMDTDSDGKLTIEEIEIYIRTIR